MNLISVAERFPALHSQLHQHFCFLFCIGPYFLVFLLRTQIWRRLIRRHCDSSDVIRYGVYWQTDSLPLHLHAGIQPRHKFLSTSNRGPRDTALAMCYSRSPKHFVNATIHDEVVYISDQNFLQYPIRPIRYRSQTVKYVFPKSSATLQCNWIHCPRRSRTCRQVAGCTYMYKTAYEKNDYYIFVFDIISLLYKGKVSYLNSLQMPTMQHQIKLKLSATPMREPKLSQRACMAEK